MTLMTQKISLPGNFFYNMFCNCGHSYLLFIGYRKIVYQLMFIVAGCFDPAFDIEDGGRSSSMLGKHKLADFCLELTYF